MSNFATPKWDSTDFGDEMCSKLFQGDKNKKKLGNKKEGNIKKAKKKLNSKINPTLLQNIGRQMTEVKNKINGKLSKNQDTVSLTNSPKKKGKKRGINGELIGNLTEKIKNLTNKETTKRKSTKDVQKLQNEDGELIGNLSGKINNLTNKKKKTKNVKKLQNDINKKIDGGLIGNLNDKIKNLTNKKKKTKDVTNMKLIAKDTPKKKQKLKNKLNKIRETLKDTQIANDVSDKYTKTIIQLKKIQRNNEDSEALLNSPKKRGKKSLRERMMDQLKASRFRYLNEQIYTSESKNAQELFVNDPEAFEAYHEGYRQQVHRWPVNPVDIIIKDIKKMSKTLEIADLGCGDAKLALEVPQKVHSFDLVAANERVVACDMSKVPLGKSSVDVVVFCLSLMGTNLHDYLKEANRLLKIGGILKIAEVESRFDDVDNFIKGVQHFGFQNVHKNFTHNLFYFMDFKKLTNIKKTKSLPTLSLHPCLYKKR